jgi:hypothetical protein
VESVRCFPGFCGIADIADIAHPFQGQGQESICAVVLGSAITEVRKQIAGSRHPSRDLGHYRTGPRANGH